MLFEFREGFDCADTTRGELLIKRKLASSTRESAFMVIDRLPNLGSVELDVLVQDSVTKIAVRANCGFSL